ncbi:MAG: thioredoxin [Alphaproteobacteria bacterium HGW-Alphaproteobacteria-16]|nr:MAG: thioredoxin [Alphaproteobacteria bacterium HGW-Alphaproteobacteria-16]
MAKAVTDASFEADVLQSDKPVIVDFWAEWCGPCKIIGPSLDELSEELADKVTIAKLNIEENPDTPGKLGIRGIPTLFVYKDGQKVAQQVGIAEISTKSKLKAWIESIV